LQFSGHVLDHSGESLGNPEPHSSSQVRPGAAPLEIITWWLWQTMSQLSPGSPIPRAGWDNQTLEWNEPPQGPIQPENMANGWGLERKEREVRLSMSGMQITWILRVHSLNTMNLFTLIHVGVFFFFFLAALGLGLRASQLLGKHSCNLSHSTSPFIVMGFFKIGSHELFAQDWLQTMILLMSAS
jgi:hypothetical protein